MITVLLTDADKSYNQAKRYFDEAETWAREHCESFVDSNVLWVGDASHVHDIMGEYEFEDSCDALVFKLRWL